MAHIRAAWRSRTFFSSPWLPNVALLRMKCWQSENKGLKMFRGVAGRSENLRHVRLAKVTAGGSSYFVVHTAMSLCCSSHGILFKAMVSGYGSSERGKRFELSKDVSLELCRPAVVSCEDIRPCCASGWVTVSMSPIA